MSNSNNMNTNLLQNENQKLLNGIMWPEVLLLIDKSMNNNKHKVKLFIVDAGKIIMIISIILWFLVSFPKNDIGKISINNTV